MRGRLHDSVDRRFVHTTLLSSPARTFIRSKGKCTSQCMVKVTQKALIEIPVRQAQTTIAGLPLRNGRDTTDKVDRDPQL